MHKMYVANVKLKLLRKNDFKKKYNEYTKSNL